MKGFRNISTSMTFMTKIFAVAVLLSLCSCHRRPLEDPNMLHYIRVYSDEKLLNVTTGFYNPEHEHPEFKRPEVFRLSFYDSETGKLTADRFLRNSGEDERGHYWDGYIALESGDYMMVAYGLGTEYTNITDNGNFRNAIATTDVLPSFITNSLHSTRASGNIRFDADHLLASVSHELRVPSTPDIDTLRAENGERFFIAESVVKSYYLQIKVKGVKYLSDAVCLQTGLAQQKLLSTGDISDSPEATIYFETNTDVSDSDADTGVIYATFGTFGKLPDADNQLSITFELSTNYGKIYLAELDITDEYATENARVHQWIIIEKEIQIPEPSDDGGSGLTPSVGEWDDIQSDIVI